MEKIYCAVYTRKSTSEGLNSEFTTLDAQRDAGLSYIASQKSEGWEAISKKYDDGGFTGANIERPALQELLTDIKAGHVNCVVVYKVDRLSRSLTDFAKLLEFFEAQKVAFVSVTQQFNTNSSMGRLTLNILLSFAQFERELISERTKDKVAAARKKGRFMGGMPMLGYDRDPVTKRLVVNEVEAKAVRKVFQLYLQMRSFLSVVTALNEQGIPTKRFAFKSGKGFGGRPFVKNIVARILSNPIYIGKIEHQGVLYDGLHKAIVSNEVFDKTQKLIARNVVERARVGNTQDASLLRHILWCANCKTRMSPTYASKKNIKYRYYVCFHTQRRGYNTCPTQSVKAHEIEQIALQKLSWIIDNTPELKDKNLVLNTPVWDVLFQQERRRVLNMLVKSIEYNSVTKKLAIELNPTGIEELQKETGTYAVRV